VRITAVVLNWRRSEDTIACVRSVQATAPEVAVIVVDNASGDGSMERMRAQLTDVTFIQNPTNAGYAGGNNAGIASALSDEACEAVFVLNNDVIVRPGCVARLAHQQSRGYQIVAPVSLRADDPTICDFWRAEVDLKHLAVRAIGRDEPWLPPKESEATDYATGSAMLVRADALRALGGFDERFFLVWEDVDLSLRARAMSLPLQVRAVPDAEVLHGQSVSFGGADSALYRYFYTRNAFLLIDKHLGSLRKARTRAMIERRFRGGIDAEPDEVTKRILQRGLDDGLAARFGAPPADLLA